MSKHTSTEPADVFHRDGEVAPAPAADPRGDLIYRVFRY